MASDKQVSDFLENGFSVLEDFVSENEVAALEEECKRLVEGMDPSQHHTVFSTTKHSHTDNYFIKSADSIGFFFEDGALDDKGNLKVDKHKSLNKIGHAMHLLCPEFKKLTFNGKVKDVLRSLKYEDPVVMQSMYIFKQPGIGGAVTPHQDGSYLYAEPLKVMGMWLALEDATVDNGCLWFVPGSQKGGVYGDYRMIRNPNAEKDGKSCIYIGEKPDYDSYGDWVPVPVKKGTLILIDGLVLHKSEPNTSNRSRHIYTFHVYDAAGKWSDRNWLQPTPADTFCHVYDTQP